MTWSGKGEGDEQVEGIFENNMLHIKLNNNLK